MHISGLLQDNSANPSAATTCRFHSPLPFCKIVGNYEPGREELQVGPFCRKGPVVRNAFVRPRDFLSNGKVLGRVGSAGGTTDN
jgi:hypothetical protein